MDYTVNVCARKWKLEFRLRPPLGTGNRIDLVSKHHLHVLRNFYPQRSIQLHRKLVAAYRTGNFRFYLFTHFRPTPTTCARSPTVRFGSLADPSDDISLMSTFECKADGKADFSEIEI